MGHAKDITAYCIRQKKTDSEVYQASIFPAGRRSKLKLSDSKFVDVVSSTLAPHLMDIFNAHLSKKLENAMCNTECIRWVDCTQR